MFAGLLAIIYKEVIQVRRDPATKVVFLIPVIQLLVFGYAINTDVRHMPTIVFNCDRRLESRQFLAKFGSTDVFRITEEAACAADVRQAIVAGRVQVGIIIPPDFSDDLANRRTAHVQVLIDGSNNTVAFQALNVANGIAIDEVVKRLKTMLPGRMPVELRPKVLFNENLESANFFVPGLVGIILQVTTVFLTSFSIVRERERGTLEQLMVTPISRPALMLGKLVPFAVIGCFETCVVLALMVFVFGVPIAGSKVLLLALSALFLLPSLGLGILISTVATNQAQATQLGILVMLPSVLLSGFVFPRPQMPLPIYIVSCFIPVTYYIDILRGIILRGASAWQLWLPSTVLLGFGGLIFLASTLRFKKRLE
ncbi:MAG: ABC transporter permease [Pirellulales bacterium]